MSCNVHQLTAPFRLSRPLYYAHSTPSHQATANGNGSMYTVHCSLLHTIGFNKTISSSGPSTPGFRAWRGKFTAFNGSSKDREGGMYIDGGFHHQAVVYDGGELCEPFNKSIWLGWRSVWVNFLVYGTAWHGGFLNSFLRTHNE